MEMAADGVVLRSDHIYGIPPHKEISLYSGVIQLLDPVDREASLPIDFFFRSLAADRGNRAVAVVLSGTGSDGTAGLKEVKADLDRAWGAGVEHFRHEPLAHGGIG